MNIKNNNIIMDDSRLYNLNYWKISVGRKGILWRKFYKDGVIAVGNWNVKNLGDLKKYKDINSLKKIGISGSGSQQLWDFYRRIKVGDMIFAYGNNHIQGMGEIVGKYHQIKNDVYFKGENYVRSIKWQAFEPPISIHQDHILWGLISGKGPFTRNATLVLLEQVHVDRLNKIFLEKGIKIAVSSLTYSQKVQENITIQGERTNISTESQGYCDSTEIRNAIETYSMRLAEKYFRRLGYTITNTSERNPYDLICKRDREILHVEVKGMQSAGNKVILTRNEVEFAQNPNNKMALLIVSEIKLSGTVLKPTVSGGKISIINPWRIETRNLSVINYNYTIKV